MSHTPPEGDTEEARMVPFNRIKIRMCEKLVEFEKIGAVSPIDKRDADNYEVVIDPKVYDAFCGEQ